MTCHQRNTTSVDRTTEDKRAQCSNWLSLYSHFTFCLKTNNKLMKQKIQLWFFLSIKVSISIGNN